MADVVALMQPRIVDRDAFDDFVNALEDQVAEIERNVAALRKDPEDGQLVARLFRSLHTIKGDAAICRVEVGVAICHPIESLLSRCRDGEILFSGMLTELVLLALDRLELVIEALDAGRPTSHLNLPQLVGGLERIAGASVAEVPGLCADVIEAVTGFRSERAPSGEMPLPEVQHQLETNRPQDQTADLAFFHSLALRLEERSPLFRGRTERILRLALETNESAGAPVDATQLQAAVFMHDVGMMFAPEACWLKVGRLSEDDRVLLNEHPQHGSGLLQRMPGWQGAAEIVLQHHEMSDGGGYPAGLHGEGICAGAKILAIVDAFEAVTLKHSDRGHTRSLVRAIAEINACDNQFSPEWIVTFNSVIRAMIER